MPTTRDPRVGNRLDIPAYIKDKRRIVDLLERRPIGGIILTDDGNTSGRYASHLVMGQFHRLASTERLVRRRLDAGRFEFGQRRLQDVLDAAEGFDQPPRPGGPRRGVRTRASHCRDFRSVWDTRPGLRACHHLHIAGRLADSYNRKKRLLKSNIQVEQWLHETPSYFRDFLP